MTSRIERRAKAMRRKMPGTKTIVLTPVGKSSVAGTAVSVKYAEKRPMTKDYQKALEIEIDVESCVWALWTDELHGLTPLRSWLITDPSGVSWQIKKVDATLLENRLLLPCIRLIGRQ